MLQNKGLMDGAVLWPVACLSRRPQIMLLCELNKALNQDASIQPAEGLAHCYRPVVSCIRGITLLNDINSNLRYVARRRRRILQGQ